MIKAVGHKYVFLLMFQDCELDPIIEMVSNDLLSLTRSTQRTINRQGWCKYKYREHPTTIFFSSQGAGSLGMTI